MRLNGEARLLEHTTAASSVSKRRFHPARPRSAACRYPGRLEKACFPYPEPCSLHECSYQRELRISEHDSFPLQKEAIQIFWKLLTDLEGCSDHGYCSRAFHTLQHLYISKKTQDHPEQYGFRRVTNISPRSFGKASTFDLSSLRLEDVSSSTRTRFTHRNMPII